MRILYKWRTKNIIIEIVDDSLKTVTLIPVERLLDGTKHDRVILDDGISHDEAHTIAEEKYHEWLRDAFNSFALLRWTNEN